MTREKWRYIAAGMGILLLVAALMLLLLRNEWFEPVRIVLPEIPAKAGNAGEVGEDSRVSVVAITPDTVRPAVSTLSRPMAYQRTQTVETFWSGGSGKSVYQVAVSNGYTRLDTVLSDGSTLHQLSYGTAAVRWYDEESEYQEFKSEAFSSDAAQRMPTYETVRDLPSEDILRAEYVEREGVRCIFVETREDEAGRRLLYWISISSGLLLAAEGYQEETLTYRFTAAEPTGEPPDEGLFLLPDGSVWIPPV